MLAGRFHRNCAALTTTRVKVGLSLPHMLAEKTCSRGDAKGTGCGGGRWGVSPFSTPAFHQAADAFPTLINLFERGREGLHSAWTSPTNTPYF